MSKNNLNLHNIRVARYKLASEKRPYLATALWALQFVESDKALSGDTPTMGVDKYWRCYYHPKLDWDVEGFVTVLYHEVWHLLRGHHQRAERFKEGLGVDAPLNFHELWNVVGDAEINDDINEEGFKFPIKEVTPTSLKAPDHLTAEEYWEYLLKQAKRVKVPRLGCGSCAGNAQPWEQGTGPQDAPTVGSAEAELIRRQTAKDIQDHVRQRGNVPAGLERWADTVLTPQVNWRRETTHAIRSFIVEAAGMVNYSYSRPARRASIYPDFVMPSLRRPIPRIGCQIDTSGSMSDNNESQAVAEVGGLLRVLGVPVIVYATDASLTRMSNVFSPKQIRLVGGGGTDMRLGFDQALRERPGLDLFITITDCATPWPEKKPPFRSIIIDVTGGTTEVPSWAKVIRIRS